jgi:hypothetical protein
MKKEIDINRKLWGNVKRFATAFDLPVNIAIESLLKDALKRSKSRDPELDLDEPL